MCLRGRRVFDEHLGGEYSPNDLSDKQDVKEDRVETAKEKEVAVASAGVRIFAPSKVPHRKESAQRVSGGSMGTKEAKSADRK
jgi:hypothetical protein